MYSLELYGQRSPCASKGSCRNLAASKSCAWQLLCRAFAAGGQVVQVHSKGFVSGANLESPEILRSCDCYGKEGTTTKKVDIGT
eukprot:1158506-Pelagomonas_calceolata.AAC.4